MILLSLFNMVASGVDPDHDATSYLVFIVIIAILLMDTMMSMTIFYLVMFIAFSLSNCLLKGPNIYGYDIHNGRVFTSAMIVLNYVGHKDTRHSFLVVIKYHELQEQLQVKAYFDQMTGLFVREVFFHILEVEIISMGMMSTIRLLWP